jgi:lipoyl-dependent peroxiredoxin
MRLWTRRFGARLAGRTHTIWMSTLYRTQATARGGRTGRVATDDGRLDQTLSIPRELGGDGGSGTNPEQLFAAGYAACFESALRLVARKQSLPLPDQTTVSAEVSLVKGADGLFQLTVSLTGRMAGIPREIALSLMEAAHRVCPYSHATRGNIPVDLDVAEETDMNNVLDAT